MSILKQSLRSTLRDFRSGELKLLFFSVFLGVAALSSVTFLSDRLESGLELNASQLLGGDLVVVSDHEAPLEFKSQALAQGLTLTETLTLATMARSYKQVNNSTHLVSLKAIENNYPLKGELKLKESLPKKTFETDASSPIKGILQSGQALVDPSVLSFLSLNLGDEMILGEAKFIISGVILDEPDKGSGFMNFSPRVMINAIDLKSTHLVLPGSRINWRLALTGPNDSLKTYQTWLTEKIKDSSFRGIRLETLKEGRPEMRATLDKSSEFLHLVSLLCALLCAIAVSISARGFALKRLNVCALYKVLGQTQSDIELVFLIEFMLLSCLASFLGLCFGYSMHLALINILSGLLDTQLPLPSAAPWWQGFLIGSILLMTFSWPPIMQLSRVSPIRIIKLDLDPPNGLSLAVFIFGLSGFCVLLLLISQHLKLGILVIAGFLLSIVIFSFFTWLILKYISYVQTIKRIPFILSMASRQLIARPGYTMLQVSSLSTGLLALMLLVLVRTDLIHNWQDSSPVDAPNRFVINLSPEQSNSFQSYLHQHNIDRFDWYPMFRGRLISINDHLVTSNDYTDDQARRLVDHSFNISFSSLAPNHNRIVKGDWLSKSPNGLSVEAGMAKTLNLDLGDRLVFDIAGESRQGVVASIREVNWTSMRANFFVMFNSSDMSDLPLTYISSFRAPIDNKFDNNLVHDFPNITEVDMDSTLKQIQLVLGQVTLAIEALFLFSLFAGLLVLFAAINLSRNDRLRDQAILRALGATQNVLVSVQRVELLSIGAFSGFFASLMAMSIGYFLSKYIFDFPWTPNFLFLIEGVLAGSLLALIAGGLGLKGVLNRPVVETLRDSPV
jgi:putative ABC transport system permease protein